MPFTLHNRFLNDFYTIMLEKLLKILGYMNTDKRPSQACLDLLLKFEGFRPLPYICPAGYLTVGIGVRIPSTKDFLKKHPHGLTLAEAQEQLLHYLVNDVGILIKTHVKVELSQNRYDALTSFIMNVGDNAFINSTILKDINAGDHIAAAKEFKRWNKMTVNGRLVVAAGLTRRRMAEECMYEGKEWRTI